MSAPCKVDLVSGVLRQLGYDTPDAETLTQTIFDVSAGLKKDNGLDVGSCLVLVPINSDWYKGSVREEVNPAKKHLGV